MVGDSSADDADEAPAGGRKRKVPTEQNPAPKKPQAKKKKSDTIAPLANWVKPVDMAKFFEKTKPFSPSPKITVPVQAAENIAPANDSPQTKPITPAKPLERGSGDEEEEDGGREDAIEEESEDKNYSEEDNERLPAEKSEPESEDEEEGDEEDKEEEEEEEQEPENLNDADNSADDQVQPKTPKQKKKNKKTMLKEKKLLESKTYGNLHILFAKVTF